MDPVPTMDTVAAGAAPLAAAVVATPPETVTTAAAATAEPDAPAAPAESAPPPEPVGAPAPPAEAPPAPPPAPPSRPEPEVDPRAELPALTEQAAGLAARMVQEGSSPATSLVAEAADLTARLMGNGTILLLDARSEDDYGACTQYFKLALQLDAGNLQVAKLLELALALFVDPTDSNARSEVDQLKAEMVQRKAQQKTADAARLAAEPPAATDSAAEAAPAEQQVQSPGVVAPGFQIVYPGVRKQLLRAGDGVTYPSKGDALTMHYTGSLAAGGVVFDSSVQRGEPFCFNIGLGQVIQGWDEGVARMSLGEKAMLHISSECAYGSEEVSDGLIPANSDLVFEVELLAVGSVNNDGEGDADLGSSVTDTVMGAVLGGMWTYLTGEDMLPAINEEVAPELLPHVWTMEGCPDARYTGVFVIDADVSVANGQPHYVNQNGMHLYVKDGWWVLKDIFTPDENSSIARCRSTNAETGPGLQSGRPTWEWWKDGGWAPVVLNVKLKQLALSVSGTPDERFNGLYREDVNNPIGNGQPHFSNVQGMHLFFGTVRGWCE
jgi:FK506-binding protein 1